MALDPVCKMFVDNQHAKKNVLYNEIRYHFCSTFCKTLFEKNPNIYIKDKGQKFGITLDFNKSLNKALNNK